MGKKRSKSKSSTDIQEIGDDDMLAMKKKKMIHKAKSQVEDTDTVLVTWSSKSLKNGKFVLAPCSESKTYLKPQKIHKEKSELPTPDDDKDDKDGEIIVSKRDFEKLTNSVKELSETVKKLQEILFIKADLLDQVTLKEKEIPKEKEEEIVTCCFDCAEAEGDNYRTILVKGFQQLQPRDDIKNALTKIFSSFGDVIRVFVPIECKTRVPLGFAFINLINGQGNDKALELNGRYMGGRKLEVKMARDTDEYYGFSDFRGCRRCIRFTARHYIDHRGIPEWL